LESVSSPTEIVTLVSPFDGVLPMSRVLELPETIYMALVEAAQANGLTPSDWIASKLPPGRPSPTPEERRESLARLLKHTVSLGHPTGVDNEQIDADLARDLASTHDVSGTTP
jgi:hypothetical protein